MSSKSNDQGRAFEYACILELKNSIGIIRPVKIELDSIFAAQIAWNLQDKTTQNKLMKAAHAFVDTLFSAEPLILECNDFDDIISLSINKDSDAEDGDVRDIVISRNNINWNIGLSLKHNHFAAKHSRLSEKIDFGCKWYGIPCSKSYWEAISPIFENLKQLKNKKMAWHNIEKKEQNVYIPLLTAFMTELENTYKTNNYMVGKLMSYLLGIRDFYKVVAIDNKEVTEFQTFNLRGELNRDGKHSKSTFFVPVAELPTEIIKLRFKPASTNTVELYMNNGWSLSFRIHNASTMVEPSLKFDIQFLGVPANIITVNCKWL